MTSMFGKLSQSVPSRPSKNTEQKTFKDTSKSSATMKSMTVYFNSRIKKAFFLYILPTIFGIHKYFEVFTKEIWSHCKIK